MVADSGVTPRNRWNDAETTTSPHGRVPWRTAIRAWLPSAGSRRRTVFDKRCHAQSFGAKCHTRSFDWRVGGRSMTAAAPAGRCDIRPNRIKASLRAFQRWKVKVLGFGVKARPRPQRMALRWDYDPFVLVGANGKACGEAPRVSVLGTPPGYLWCSPPAVGFVNLVHVLTWFIG